MKGGFHTGRLAALQFPAYQGQPLGEPAGGVEAVQDVTGSGKIALDGCPIGVGTVSLYTCLCEVGFLLLWLV